MLLSSELEVDSDDRGALIGVLAVEDEVLVACNKPELRLTRNWAKLVLAKLCDLVADRGRVCLVGVLTQEEESESDDCRCKKTDSSYLSEAGVEWAATEGKEVRALGSVWRRDSNPFILLASPCMFGGVSLSAPRELPEVFCSGRSKSFDKEGGFSRFCLTRSRSVWTPSSSLPGT